MAEALLDSGNVHVIAGLVDMSNGTDSVLASRDGAATSVNAATGIATITFGAAFRSAPNVVATVVKANSTTVISTAILTSVTATDCVVNVVDYTQAATITALADRDFQVMIIGSRDR